MGTRRETVSPPAPQGLVDRVKSLGWFTLALVAVIGVVLLATGIKALISADGGLGAPAPVNMSNSSVQFISAPASGNEVGQHRNAAVNTVVVAQTVKKDAQW